MIKIPIFKVESLFKILISLFIYHAFYGLGLDFFLILVSIFYDQVDFSRALLFFADDFL